MKPRTRSRTRRYGQNDNVFTFARNFTLAHIGASAPDASENVAHDFVEPAWDGHRVLATKAAHETRLAALDYRDWRATFPLIAKSLGKLASHKIAIDGVVCVLDARGAPSFESLRSEVQNHTHVRTAVLVCWDLLWDGDDDLRDRPLAERRERLDQLLHGAPEVLMPSQPLPGSVSQIVQAALSLGLRGVVARQTSAPYASSWHAHAAGPEAIDFRRSLSPPPPITNADKVLYPRDGIDKKRIVLYYRDIAPIMLPYLRDRPAVIQRWPDGIDDFDWYQHRVPPRAPDYIRAAWVDGVRRIVLENADALLWMVNQAGLTYHAFGSRLSALEEPDWAMIDLDPGARTNWYEEMIAVALAVRRTLELLELPSVVKTSGQRGLHVLVPLAPGHTFAQAETFARAVAMLLEKLMPEAVTLETEKDKRHGRLLVDHKQFMAKTLVAPYSLRAADGATVSTPLAWSEVGPKLDRRKFTLQTVFARIDRVGDLAAPLVDARAGVSLAAALAQLNPK